MSPAWLPQHTTLRSGLFMVLAMGSFVVEGFSITRLMEITREDIERRVADFHQLVSFDKALNA